MTQLTDWNKFVGQLDAVEAIRQEIQTQFIDCPGGLNGLTPREQKLLGKAIARLGKALDSSHTSLHDKTEAALQHEARMLLAMVFSHIDGSDLSPKTLDRLVAWNKNMRLWLEER